MKHFEKETLTMLDYRFNAQCSLDSLRKSGNDWALHVSHINDSMRDGNLSLADIGTSEEELEELKTKGCKVVAQDSLKCLRGNGNDHALHIHHIRDAVKEGNFSLADIGTSEEELAGFKVNGCKTVAKSSLDSLRNSPNDHALHVYSICEAMRDGGFSHADIGTSEDELASFAKKAT